MAFLIIICIFWLKNAERCIIYACVLCEIAI